MPRSSERILPVLNDETVSTALKTKVKGYVESIGGIPAVVPEGKEDGSTVPDSTMREVVDPRHGRIRVTQHVYDLIEKDKREWCPQRTDEWLAKRRMHITASQMAAVCNANPYESRSSALKKKTGVQKPFQGNAATEHGNKYEMEAILKYEKVTGAKCLEFGLLESLNEGEDYLAGSPDGITASGRLIEVKCPLRRKPTEKIPSYYRFQIQFLMHTLRLPECDFIQYVPGSFWMEETFIVTREKYNPYFWFTYEPMMRSFWAEVQEVRAAIANAKQRKADEPDVDVKEPPKVTTSSGITIDIDVEETPVDAPPVIKRTRPCRFAKNLITLEDSHVDTNAISSIDAINMPERIPREAEDFHVGPLFTSCQIVPEEP